MKFQTVLMVTLLSTLALSAQGKILKSLLSKKLSLISSLGGKRTSGHAGTSTFGFISQQAGRPTTNRPIDNNSNESGEITHLSEIIQQPHLIEGSSLVEQGHPISGSVAAVYSYAPSSEYQTPSVYYRESPQPVISRTVYEYVEAPRTNLGFLPGINNIPIISQVKSLLNNALRLPSAPATTSAITYISY